jgi:hypothetical protein
MRLATQTEEWAAVRAQVSQVQMDAHFHAVHLIAVMAKLLPEWLPRPLFDLLHRQWNLPARRAR